jgi:hypothetical protein
VSHIARLIEANRQTGQGYLNGDEQMMAFAIGWDDRVGGQSWVIATQKGLVNIAFAKAGQKRSYAPYENLVRLKVSRKWPFKDLLIQTKDTTIMANRLNRASPWQELVDLVNEKIAQNETAGA